MKKLSLLLVLSMLPVLALAPPDSPSDAQIINSQTDPMLTPADQDQVHIQVSNGCVTLTPDSRDFGNQPVDFASASEPFHLQNGCNVSLTVNNITANGQSFTQTNNCIGTLRAGDMCEIDVVFDPVSAGVKSQTLVINYQKQGNPNPMQISGGLTGTGIHDLTFNPTSCDFLSLIYDGQGTEAYCTVTLQNQEPVRLVLDRCHVSPAPPFSQDTACPAFLSKKGNPGDSVNITLDFQSDVSGLFMGQFAVTTNSPEEQQSGNPYIVPLIGVARPICNPPMCCNGSGPCPPPSDLGTNITTPSN